MKYVWSKETRNENGVNYRAKQGINGWRHEVEDDFDKPGFTDAAPPQECIDGDAECDWNEATGTWDVRPRTLVKTWGRALETLRPYYVSRSLMNQYQAMSAAEKEAFRAQFQVGDEDRWTILKNFVIGIRMVWAQNHPTWMDWDIAHPEYTEADFRAAWATIQSWGKEGS